MPSVIREILYPYDDRGWEYLCVTDHDDSGTVGFLSYLLFVYVGIMA